jgi:transcriptional regulator with XRE-family HTH domain
MDIGSKIKALRKGRNMTQEQLAERSGVAQSAISYIECHSKQPNIDTIIRIAQTLGVSVDQLIGLNKDLDLDENTPNYLEGLPTGPSYTWAKEECDIENMFLYGNLYYHGQRLNAQEKQDILDLTQIIWRRRHQDAIEANYSTYDIYQENQKREWIKNKVENLVQNTNSREPHKIATAMGVKIIRKKPDKLKDGEAPNGLGITITLADDVESATERYLLARQIGHLVLHDPSSYIGGYHQSMQHEATNKDADLFAAYLLVKNPPKEGEDLLEYSEREDIPPFLLGLYFS